MTDSEGIQEEAITLGVPVLVLRDETERPEVIEVGGGLLAGVTKNNIIRIVEELADNNYIYDGMKNCLNPFGDGKSSQHIAEILLKVI